MSDRGDQVQKLRRQVGAKHKRTCVLVLGMHRSGTSALTRVLNIAGARLPADLMGPFKGNAPGHWESHSLMNYHDALLNELGSRWDDWQALQLGHLSIKRRGEIKTEILGILEAEFGDAALFVVKDPRICRFAPIFLKALSRAGNDVRVVLTVRNPLEVCESLEQRDGMARADAALLWLRHVLDSENATRDTKRTIVTYNGLLNDWKAVFGKISDKLEIEGLYPITEIAPQVSEFLSPSHRHHARKTDDVVLDPMLRGWVGGAYEALLVLARNPGSQKAMVRLDDISREFGRASPILHRFFQGARIKHQSEITDLNADLATAGSENEELGTKLAQAEAGLAERTAHAEHLEIVQRERDKEISDLRAETEAGRAERETKVAELGATLAERTAQAEQLKDDLRGRDKEIADLRAEILEFEKKNAALIESLAVRDQEAAIHENALAEAKKETAGVKLALTKQNKKTDELNEMLSEAESQRRTLEETGALENKALSELLQRKETALEAEKGKARELQKQFTAKNRETLEAKAQLSLSEEWRQAYVNSTSWRITAPIRAFGDFVRRKKNSRNIDLNDAGAGPASAGEYYVQALDATPALSPEIRSIAFYLPQYHPIPENDEWWGKGFTEWTNVTSAEPQFPGHCQPQLPGELGYYDLRVSEIQERQVDLAKQYGISGFCFYLYWFAGKTLLELPTRNYLDNKNLSFPFCLCWANENWTRRWDGLDNDLLIAQDHTDNDDIEFIAHISSYLRDDRYIKIDGKPLVIVYRPNLLPNPVETANRWREWCRENGIGDIYLAYCQSFEIVDPGEYGFDAAIEFPPNQSGIPEISGKIEKVHTSFQGRILDWKRLVEKSENYENPGYKLFRGVCPSWDNTARRGNAATILVNSNPSDFQAWMQNAIADTVGRFENPDERLIFVNAWNEWAEGCHLEPDQKYGYAWLQAIRLALQKTQSVPRRIVVVTHDLHPHGAQYLVLHIAESLHARFGCDIATVSCGEGDFTENFERLGPLFMATRDNAGKIAATLAADGYQHAIINSCAAGWMTSYFKKVGISCVALVHEMPQLIADSGFDSNIRAMDEFAKSMIFPSHDVRKKTGVMLNLKWRNAKVLPQGIYLPVGTTGHSDKEAARTRVCSRLGLPSHARIVLGVGYGDHRKGVDIFISWGLATAMTRDDVHFVWIGAISPQMKEKCEELLDQAGAATIHFPFTEFIDDIRDFYIGADIYALSSREDPFPSSALEALAFATPIIMVRGTGGIEDLAPSGAVRILETTSADEFVAHSLPIITDIPARLSMGQAGQKLVRSRFGFESYVSDLLRELDISQSRVSVIVPNYNYERYLEQRLKSIIDQTLPPWEIILLDDCSDDGSLAVAEKTLGECNINYRIVCNKANSGNVFDQWRKGVDLAQGDYIWIAEADDFAEPVFLASTMKGFETEDVVLSYTQSKQIAQDGSILCGDYLDYVNEVSPEQWRASYKRSGHDEICNGLSIKNTIPNVSAALFKKSALLKILKENIDEIANYRVAGDWCVYVNLLRHGSVHFNARPLNCHRRHDKSVTICRFGLEELNEISKMQARIAREFDVPQVNCEKARDYLESLIEQFDLRQRFSRREIDSSIDA